MNDYCLCINCVINRNNECDKCQIYNKRIIANDIYFQYTTTNLELHVNDKIFKKILNPNQIIIINLHNFPETLEKIYIRYAIFDVGIKYKVILNNMPSKLKKLVCIRCCLDKLDNLPLSLKYLDCSHNNITNLDFLPEGLEYLNCSSNKLNKLEDLPLSLKYLITGKNNIVNYFSLPPNLIKLNDALFNDVSTYQQSIKLLSNYKQYVCKLNANKYI